MTPAWDASPSAAAAWPPPSSGDFAAYRRQQRIRVLALLLKEFGLSHNDAEKRVRLCYSPGFLPNYFYFSNTPYEVARQIIILTQFLDANAERVALESADGRQITYFMNVGANIPGKLADLLAENAGAPILELNSIRTLSGYRIVSFQKRYLDAIPLSATAREGALELARQAHLAEPDLAAAFLAALPPNYLHEELCSCMTKPRWRRHLRLYALAQAQDGLLISTDDVSGERDEDRSDPGERLRFNLAMRDPATPNLLEQQVRVFKNLRVNLSRTYYDRLRDPVTGSEVHLTSIYLADASRAAELTDALRALPLVSLPRPTGAAATTDAMTALVPRLLGLAKSAPAARAACLAELRTLVARNRDPAAGPELGDYLLNALTVFMEGAAHSGLDQSPRALELLLGFERVAEFVIESHRDGLPRNRTGYRIRHSSVRGPAKGGLRLHPAAVLTEVAALAFMMTWKCARARIRFGGGKGGALLDPREFSNPMEYADTVANFGKGLFLETGPLLDVPAGDVNCGPPEIGMIFEGYRAALRDLAALAYGSRFGVARIGKRIVTLNDAREILEHHFGVDPYDDELLTALMTSERYLSLVLAAQITGKPTLGIAARNGATGAGLCFVTLAAIARLHLAGQWPANPPLAPPVLAALRRAASLTPADFNGADREPALKAADWDLLHQQAWPALLTGRRVVIQGFGKVGSAFLQELLVYGVRVVGAADYGGAVIGAALDPADLLRAAKTQGTVAKATGGVTRRLPGASEGLAVLEEDCDLLLPCALENAITADNAPRLRTRLIVGGANGPVSPRAAALLQARGIPVVHDFLANAGGVIASYFEWLRGLAERRRYEAVEIRHTSFYPAELDPWLMPEFASRLRAVLAEPENSASDQVWRLLLRDLQFANLNDDWNQATRLGVRLELAGMMDAQARVLAATLAHLPSDDARAVWRELPERTRRWLVPALQHPELAPHHARLAPLLAMLEPADLPS